MSESFDTLQNLPFAVGDRPLYELLTVLIVTSPIAAHPSTELIDRLLSSLARSLRGFVSDDPTPRHCRVIVAGDGVFIGERKHKRIFGHASIDEAQRYIEYLDRLRVGVVCRVWRGAF